MKNTYPNFMIHAIPIVATDFPTTSIRWARDLQCTFRFKHPKRNPNKTSVINMQMQIETNNRKEYGTLLMRNACQIKYSRYSLMRVNTKLVVIGMMVERKLWRAQCIHDSISTIIPLNMQQRSSFGQCVILFTENQTTKTLHQLK